MSLADRASDGDVAGPDSFLGGSFGVYLGEVHTDDPFAAETHSSEQSVFFGLDGEDFVNLLRASGDTSEPGGLQVDVNPNDFTLTFFNPMLVSDARQQRFALEALTSTLLKSLKSPPHSLLRAQLPTIVRFATESPFDLIRHHFSAFLEQIKPDILALNLHLPKPRNSPSRFFPAKAFVPIDTKSREEQEMYRSAFLAFGRVSHLLRVFAWHPQYYESYSQVYNFLMRVQTGPLPRHVRNYIAIMSAARFRCAYLVDEQEREFIRNKGDPTWLQGVHFAPKKLQALQLLSTLMAFQPWKVSKDHIEALTKGPGEESWSIAEVVQALVIISNFHALSGIVWGCGVAPEVDSTQYTDSAFDSLSPSPSPSTPTGTTLAPTTPDVMEDDMTHDILSRMKKGFDTTKMEEMTMSGKLEMFAAAEKNNSPKGSKDAAPPGASSKGTSDSGSGALPKMDKKDEYTENGIAVETKYSPGFLGYNHVDFDMKTDEILNIADFGWGTQGFSLVKRYYSEAAALLDEHFKVIRSLTYERFAGQTVNTEPFRMAVWYYTHRVCGVFHDDYDYSKVNQLVHQKTKSYVKKVAVEPFMIDSSDLNLGMQFLPEEKAHISFLAADSRRQASLLYGLRAVAKYLSSK